ncbi:DUF502 domain-containing protein [bacterium]|nr:DUF502 domain-containing protein [bacterium]MCI0612973.1 DUF502 domain-containing protein [bacterium]
MKKALAFAGKACFSGLIIIIPIYLAILLLLKGMKSVVGLVKPFALLLPEWFPAEKFLSLLLVLLICFIIGVLVRTPAGRAARERIEKGFFERIPGYALLRSLTQQITKDTQETVWKPALAEIEDALVPAFIIEEFEDGRFTVFVPSIPTPFAGAVYILDRKRVHPLDVAFTDALRVVSKWGSGARDLALAMEKG